MCGCNWWQDRRRALNAERARPTDADKIWEYTCWVVPFFGSKSALSVTSWHQTQAAMLILGPIDTCIVTVSHQEWELPLPAAIFLVLIKATIVVSNLFSSQELVVQYWGLCNSTICIVFDVLPRTIFSIQYFYSTALTINNTCNIRHAITFPLYSCENI